MGEVQGEEWMGEVQGEARKGLQNGLFLDDLNEVATMGIYRERMDLFNSNLWWKTQGGHGKDRKIMVGQVLSHPLNMSW